MVVVIAGPTAVGKSEIAVRLAEKLHGEIINFDSIQLYRGFDIGSAKPSAEMRQRVPHHLFDVLDAEQDFNAAEYARVAGPLLKRIQQPILAGGTFFYLRALLAGLPEMPARDEKIRERLRRISVQRKHRWLSKVDPRSAAIIPPPDRHRVERALEVWIRSGRPISEWHRPEGEIPSVKIGLRVDRKLLVEQIDARVEQMYRAGLVEETRHLLSRYPPTARPFSAIGYKEAVAVVDGRLTAADAMAETRRRTRAYAKRQLTWLRAERNVHWVDAADREEAFAKAVQFVEGES